jgi:pentapeptide MXKDX repeat protein
LTTGRHPAPIILADAPQSHLAFQEALMHTFTGWLTRAVVVVAVGLSFGLGGVVDRALAQSDTMKKDEMMKKDDMMKGEMKKDDQMMKKDEMMKSDMKKDQMMKDDKTMKKDDAMMEKKQ